MELLINNKKVKVESRPGLTLLDALRNDLELTGAKYGCGEAQCGACTVLMDGHAVRSCVTPLSAAQGKEVLTIEGLANGGKLHPLQQTFIDTGAMQCGYCTPGMIMSALALLQAKPEPSEADVIQGMNGNICRCGTYPRILQALRAAAVIMREETR